MVEKTETNGKKAVTIGKKNLRRFWKFGNFFGSQLIKLVSLSGGRKVLVVVVQIFELKKEIRRY